jgi:hypothetical protein
VPARSRSHLAIERSEVTEGLLGSSLLRKPETLRGLLVEELTISSDVSLPDVVVTGKLGAFLEDELDGRKRRRRLGGTRGIRQTAGDEHEDGGCRTWFSRTTATEEDRG